MLCSARVCQDKCSSHAVKEWQYMILNKNIASVHKTLTIYSTQISNPTSHTHYEHCTSLHLYFISTLHQSQLKGELWQPWTTFPACLAHYNKNGFHEMWGECQLNIKTVGDWSVLRHISILHVRLDSHTILLCWCPSWKRINLHHIWIEDHKDGGSL